MQKEDLMVAKLLKGFDNFDPVRSMENITGKDHSEFDDLERLIVMETTLSMNRTVTEAFKNSGDTYFGIKWDNLITLLLINGFREGMSYTFNDGREERAALFYNVEKGLVVWATTHGNIINDGRMYGFFKYHTPIEKVMKKSFYGILTKEELVITPEFESALMSISECGLSGSDIHSINDGVSFSFDIRKGMISTLICIEEYFTFMPKWPREQFLWLLDRSEYGGYYNDHYKEKSIRSKIERCPKDLQEIIHGYKNIIGG